jgi:pyruvate/2-oxoglutarate dehydrogenase complex dihydrolipoamide dehydrogenase (E3) component
MKHFNDIVIGFGKGGKTLAGYLAKQGRKVALIEKDNQMYGGTCINVGCIPSKSLITSALNNLKGPQKRADFAEAAERYAAAINEKRRVTSMLRQKNYDKLAQNPNAEVVDGTAAFVNNKEIVVTSPKGQENYVAERFFINTGSVSIIPPIPGLKDNPLAYDSKSLMELDKLPKRLLIIGGGYIGVEFASMYASFGSEVTMIQDQKDFLPREDRDVAASIQEILTAKGIKIIAGAAITKVSHQDKTATIEYTQDKKNFSVSGEAVLVATGRRPNTDGLNLEAAGVQVTPRGAVVTDKTLKTTAPNIWAMGDVVGGLQFTYVSLDDYRIVKGQLEGKNAYTLEQRKHVPFSVFMDPPFSRVGLSETEAQQAGYKFRVLKMPAAAIPKAQVLRHPAGMLKAIVEEKTGKILGAMLLCEESYEMINIVKLAMDMNADYTVLRDQVFTHPTMSEALNDLFSL